MSNAVVFLFHSTFQSHMRIQCVQRIDVVFDWLTNLKWFKHIARAIRVNWTMKKKTAQQNEIICYQYEMKNSLNI